MPFYLEHIFLYLKSRSYVGTIIPRTLAELVSWIHGSGDSIKGDRSGGGGGSRGGRGGGSGGEIIIGGRRVRSNRISRGKYGGASWVGSCAVTGGAEGSVRVKVHY